MRTLPVSHRVARLRQRSEAGIVLIAALAVLLMLTLLSIGMFHSFGLEERITGNTREKQHAFYAAQSALQNAEAWLHAGSAGVPTACSLTSVSDAPQVCNAATTPSQQTLATTLWNCSYGTPFVPPSVDLAGTWTQQMTTQTDCAGAATQGTYYEDPQYAITYLGPDPANQGTLYQVTAMGYGGNQNAVAVVQSVYFVSSGTTVVSK